MTNRAPGLTPTPLHRMTPRGVVWILAVCICLAIDAAIVVAVIQTF